MSLLEFAAAVPKSCDALATFDVSRLPTPIRREIDRQWERGPIAVTASLDHGPAPLIVAAKLPEDTPLDITRRYGAIARALVRERVRSAAVAVPAAHGARDAAAVVLGLSRGLYRFDRYKSAAPAPAPTVTVVGSVPLRRAGERARAVADGIALCRDLVNTPAEDMGPGQLEAAARDVARQTKLKLRVLDAKTCAEMGMGALTAVGRAAHQPPRLVILEHRGAPDKRELLALCGKGICFDTGGLDIKTADGMLLMKKDMGGAATVLGAALAVGRLKPRKNVRFYLAIAENALGNNAMRPGDILRALDGTTIEIGNTDAEGRLVLADAVALAVREGATQIVDAATLTGAALIALGRVRVPLVGSDEALLAAVERSATAMGERVWRMPDDQEYKDAFKSKIADLKNVGKGSEAGVLSGGLFIGHFAKSVPWAHLDISPASYLDAEHDLGPDGATGVMVPTLAHLALGGKI